MSRPVELKDVLGRDLLKDVGADLIPNIKEKRVAELLNLKGKKAVVTGAGGPGLGQACAHRLAGCGADVAVVDINMDGARRVAEEVTKLWGTRAIPVHGDVCDWDIVHRFMRESHDRLGGIDILVNNALGGQAGGLFEKLTKEQIDKTIHGTVTSVAYCCRAVLDYMIAQRSGRIINVASEGAFNPYWYLALYDSGKANIVHLTRSIAHEVAPYGIYVLGVAPGTMLNARLQESLRHPTEENRSGWAAILESFERAELGRVSAPEEVANMVAFLASDAASFMCGTTVHMGGGQA